MQSIWGRKTSGTLMALAIGLAGASSASSARADDNDRGKELEERLAEMERQLSAVQDRGGLAVGYNSELEARIAALESLNKTEKNGLGTYWSGGLRADNADKAYKFKFGGRIMNDYVFWSSDDQTEAAVGSLQTGTEFRRSRIYFAGTIHKNVEFKAQYDFAGGLAFKDVWIALKTGIGQVKVGHHFAAFGGEEQTSSKYITFMERGLQTTFAPSRKTGISLGDQSGEWNWRLGVFRQSDGFGDDEDNSGDGEWNWAARVAGRPMVSEDGKNYAHVGASLGLLKPAGDEVRFRQRPLVHISPRFVDTGTFASEDGTIMGLEAGYVAGPIHLFGEWARADMDVVGGSDATFDAFTLNAGMFLTGETRAYKNGNFARTKPKENYGEDGGSGALEAALRYSTIDLNDGSIKGGEMDVITAGLNWYLNPNTRVMLNVNFIDHDDSAIDDVHAVSLRFQIDF